MKILSSKYNTPAFHGNRRSVFDKKGALMYKTTTYFFREDLNWDRFVSLIRDKYREAEKVNIINQACSNGQESYSLVVKLIQKLGEKAEKYFPIKAGDIDYDNIESAKRGHLGIKLPDIYKINNCTNNRLTDFFSFDKAKNPENDLVLIPKNNIKDKVEFACSDIFQDVERLPEENTVLLCRNFWQYLSPDLRETLASKLSQKLNKTSLISIGEHDSACNADKLLEKYGFIYAGVEHVYTKP